MTEEIQYEKCYWREQLLKEYFTKAGRKMNGDKFSCVNIETKGMWESYGVSNFDRPGEPSFVSQQMTIMFTISEPLPTKPLLKYEHLTSIVLLYVKSSDGTISSYIGMTSGGSNLSWDFDPLGRNIVAEREDAIKKCDRIYGKANRDRAVDSIKLLYEVFPSFGFKRI